MAQRIALVGLSGSGKSTVGQTVARALGWRYVDIDALVVERDGRSIAQIFADEGEPAFRKLESQLLAEALAESRVVIATGAGIVLDPANRERLSRDAFTVWLHAPTASLLARLEAASDRPLLAQEREATLQRMAAERTALYAQVADWTIATAALSPVQIADQIVRGWALTRGAEPGDDIRVVTPGGSYSLRAGAGIWQSLPAELDALGLRGRVWLVSDTAVYPLYGPRIAMILTDAGYAVSTFCIPAGEQHKSLETVRSVYDWLLEGGVERGDVLLALGGGVVGDLAGFVAATVLRGIAVIQLPTTVLAMVDSALGGKTGVDHSVGKNLIGAFHQPRLVLADTDALQSLPAAERAAGWAEAIKHGVIGDAGLFADLQQHAAAVQALHEPITSALLARAAGFKARVVSGDEREHGGRILLNYGHTIGHAVEAESGFTIRHGEAVAIGMMVAGDIARRLDLFGEAELEQQRALLTAFGLPTRVPTNLSLAAVLGRTGSDKKVRAKRIRWVLPTGIGHAVVRDDVPTELVVTALRENQAS